MFLLWMFTDLVAALTILFSTCPAGLAETTDTTEAAKVKPTSEAAENATSHDKNVEDSDELDFTQDDGNSPADNVPGRKPLQGSVTDFDLNENFGKNLDYLSAAALNRIPEYRKIEKAVEKYRTKLQKSIRSAKDAANYSLKYRGFAMSKEGSNVLLDKIKKVNNLQAAEYMRQRYQDEMHPKVTGAIMQIAMGLGVKDPTESDRLVGVGMKSLKDLVGEDEALKTLDLMTGWKNQLNVPDTIFKKEQWDVKAFQNSMELAAKRSAATDPVLAAAKKKIKKYGYSRVASTSAGVFQASLALGMMMAPGSLSSLFSLVDTGFTMATGGPESCKILKEVYYSQSLNVRKKRILDEVALAMSNYQTAILTHNPALLACSEAVLTQLVGQKALPSILGPEIVNDVRIEAPIEIAGKAKR